MVYVQEIGFILFRLAYYLLCFKHRRRCRSLQKETIAPHASRRFPKPRLRVFLFVEKLS